MLYRFPYYMAGCLLITLAAETGLAFALGYRSRDLKFVFLANALTNPPVVFLSYLCGLLRGPQIKIISIAALELGAFLTEALIYRGSLKKRKPNPFILSLILNAASFGCGALINYFTR